MKTNDWDCRYSEVGEIPSDNSENPEWKWSYGCMHPDNESWCCPWDDVADCAFLDALPENKEVEE